MKHKIETERENLFDVNMVIAMRVRITGDPDIVKLEEAFRKAVSKFEILNSKVVIEENGDAYYIDCACPASSFNSTGMGFEELIYENERIRFRIEEGEYIRGFLTPDGIVFLMHHLGGDGRSMLFFIEEFMSSLEGSESNPIPFDNLPVSSLPKESRMPFLYKLFADSWNRKWSKMRKVFSFDDIEKSFEDFWQSHRTKTEITEYGKEELDEMLSECKKAGCSLTSYLIATWLKDDPKKADVGMAVDGRLSKRRTMGNFATGIHIRYRFDKSRSISENAVRINRLMKKRLNDPVIRYSVLQLIGNLDPTLIDTLCLEACGAYHSSEISRFADFMSYGKKKRDLSITNLMRADIRTDYGLYKISDITFVPPVVSYGVNLIGIITVNDKMIVTRHVYG